MGVLGVIGINESFSQLWSYWQVAMNKVKVPLFYQNVVWLDTTSHWHEQFVIVQIVYCHFINL